MSEQVASVRARIEKIEKSYEYFLAYAAQGLSSDRAAKSGGQLRDFLSDMESGLDGLGEAVAAAVSEGDAEPRDAWHDMVEVVSADAQAALAATRLVAAQEGISSQLIDNLNANIHLRALLTDLFLVDDLIG